MRAAQTGRHCIRTPWGAKGASGMTCITRCTKCLPIHQGGHPHVQHHCHHNGNPDRPNWYADRGRLVYRLGIGRV